MLLTIMGSALVACNNTGGSSNQMVTSSAYVLPDSSVLTSDGSVVSLSSNNIFVDKNRLANTMLYIQSTENKDLGIEFVSNQDIEISRRLQSIKDGVFVNQVRFNTTNTDYGSYKVDLVAKNLVGSPIVGSVNVNIESNSLIKASYVQLDAVGSLGTITTSGFKASNVIIFGFADTSSSAINSSYLSSIKDVMSKESENTVNLLSIGGQYSSSMGTDTDIIISNVVAQIESYNAQLTSGKINGVDLDLEGDFTAIQIKALAKGFKEKGFLVSVAPQVYLTSGSSNIDSANPTNLVLTSGSPYSNDSNYNPAISSGYVDYVMVQTYNTGGFTIDNSYSENNVEFYKYVAKALNNLVKSDCSAYFDSTSTTCIPEYSYVVIGQVANAGASGTVNNIYDSNGSTAYDQNSTLSNLKTIVDEIVANTTEYKYFAGMMMWSLNNDYNPEGWGDTSATAGAFSNQIYNAESSASVTTPYFVLQLSNLGTKSYGSVTMVVNGAYWIFGTSSNTSIAPSSNQLWGTLASSQEVSGVVDSSNLDNIFKSGATSFTPTQVLINIYSSSTTGIGNPDRQFKCNIGTYSFEANHSYNLMFNPDTNACEISKVS